MVRKEKKTYRKKKSLFSHNGPLFFSVLWNSHQGMELNRRSFSFSLYHLFVLFFTLDGIIYGVGTSNKFLFRIKICPKRERHISFATWMHYCCGKIMRTHNAKCNRLLNKLWLRDASFSKWFGLSHSKVPLDYLPNCVDFDWVICHVSSLTVESEQFCQ